MGASPDGIVTFVCWGKYVLEVNYPFSCKDKTFLEATAEAQCFLQEQNGEFTLKRDYAYFYQIQAQMQFCGTTLGDFIVWRENELVVERIPIDEAFLTDALEKATEFLTYGILPEIFGKWNSKSCEYCSAESPQTSGRLQKNTSQNIWCFCRSEESGEMIACENEQCQIIWFHTTCLRLKNIPKGKWFCPECTKGRKRKKVST